MDLNSLGFYVLAPKVRIDKGIFSDEMRNESVLRKVERRVLDYYGDKDVWFSRWFEPTWKKIDIRCLSWEDIIAIIRVKDTEFAKGISQFYEYCIRYN